MSSTITRADLLRRSQAAGQTKRQREDNAKQALRLKGREAACAAIPTITRLLLQAADNGSTRIEWFKGYDYVFLTGATEALEEAFPDISVKMATGALPFSVSLSWGV